MGELTAMLLPFTNCIFTTWILHGEGFFPVVLTQFQRFITVIPLQVNQISQYPRYLLMTQSAYIKSYTDFCLNFHAQSSVEFRHMSKCLNLCLAKFIFIRFVFTCIKGRLKGSIHCFCVTATYQVFECVIALTTFSCDCSWLGLLCCSYQVLTVSWWTVMQHDKEMQPNSYYPFDNIHVGLWLLTFN